MEKELVYLVYKTDPWHSYASRELVYIGGGFESAIDAITKRYHLDDDDINMMRSTWQTMTSGRDFEFDIQGEYINEFIDN